LAGILADTRRVVTVEMGIIKIGMDLIHSGGSKPPKWHSAQSCTLNIGAIHMLQLLKIPSK